MASDFTDIGLTSNLQAQNSLAAKETGFTPGYDFVTDNERGAITRAFMGSASIGNVQLGTAVIGTANVGTLSFNQITGGTAILGGTLNGNGVLNIKLSNGDQFINADSGSLSIYSPQLSATNKLFYISPSEGVIFMQQVDLGGSFGGTPVQDGLINLFGGTVIKVVIDPTGVSINNGFLEILGTVGVTTPNGNRCRIYVDTSGGKNRVMAQFSSGTPVVMAIQP